MYKDVFEKMQKYELSSTEKLLKYIDERIDQEPALEDLDFYYPDFDMEKNRLAFHLWLSMDYFNQDNRNLIDEFILNNKDLLEEEIEVLKSRSKSTVSLYEIIDCNEEEGRVVVLDLIRKVEHLIEDKGLSNMLGEEDIVFGRMAKIFGLWTFLGDIHYLPNFTKPIFLRQFIVNYNSLVNIFPNLTIDGYLKKHSLSLYNIYTNCVFEAMDLDEDITSILYDELDEFEAYLNLNTPEYIVKNHITNLIDFFEFYLAEDNKTLLSLDQVDFREFFQYAIEDGFISSHEDLNSFISTFKRYSYFLNKINTNYEKTYRDIKDISDKRFLLMDRFKEIEGPFEIDRATVNSISNIISLEDDSSILVDFDRFLLSVLDGPLTLDQDGNIQLEDLIDLDLMIQNSNQPKGNGLIQKSFPTLNLFISLGRDLGLLRIKDGVLMTSKKSSYYFRLKEEEKYSLFLDYLFSENFIGKIFNKMDFSKTIANIHKNLNNILIDKTIDSSPDSLDIIKKIYPYLESMGILSIDFDPKLKVELTNFGQDLLKEIIFKNKDNYQNQVVDLLSFRTIK